MPTHTVPTVGALTVSENLVSVVGVDRSNDTYSESLKLEGGGLTDMADIEAFAAQYKANTQLSVFKVVQTVVWEGQKDPDNADLAFRAQAESGINLFFRNNVASPSLSFTGRVAAPIATIMQGAQDIPLLVSPLTLLVNQYLNLLPDYALESMQYTGRKERKNNPRIGV